MDHREQIRQAYYMDGRSILPVAPERQLDHRTIRKALREPGPPRHMLRHGRVGPVPAPFVAQIDTWLQRVLAHPSKQRHTARRIIERLVDGHGFGGVSPPYAST